MSYLADPVWSKSRICQEVENAFYESIAPKPILSNAKRAQLNRQVILKKLKAEGEPRSFAQLQKLIPEMQREMLKRLLEALVVENKLGRSGPGGTRHSYNCYSYFIPA
jgi:hypothetical protein